MSIHETLLFTLIEVPLYSLISLAEVMLMLLNIEKQFQLMNVSNKIVSFLLFPQRTITRGCVKAFVTDTVTKISNKFLTKKDLKLYKNLH